MGRHETHGLEVDVGANWGWKLDFGLKIVAERRGKRPRRLLVVVPGSEVPHWLGRLGLLFDLRATAYLPGSDLLQYLFWNNDSTINVGLVAMESFCHHDFDLRMKGEVWDLVLLDGERALQQKGVRKTGTIQV